LLEEVSDEIKMILDTGVSREMQKTDGELVGVVVQVRLFALI